MKLEIEEYVRGLMTLWYTCYTTFIIHW